jgi:hypothetical protein
MVWEVFLIGTPAGGLLIAAVTAIGRILEELASRDAQTRSNIVTVPVSRSADGGRIAEAERSAA